MGALGDILSGIRIPPMAAVRQRFPRDGIRDVRVAVTRALAESGAADSIRPGMRVAITAGSRGIADIGVVLRAVADVVRDRGGAPFLVPAMGSHGGATAQGQTEVLRHLGIDDSICPIRSGMGTVKVGEALGEDVRVDANAAGADGIIVVGRVKPHTAFRGPYESGLMKMLAIGLGKREGAAACHRMGWPRMARRVEAFGRAVLEGANVLFGLALLENESGALFHAEAVLPRDIPAREPELLRLAASRMPRILLPGTDVLVVDYIGKDISGDGADPNVTGAFMDPGMSGTFRCQNLCVLDLTDASGGSVVGIGAAQATTRRLLRKMDAEASVINALASRELNIVRMPPAFPSDRAAIAACLEACAGADSAYPRMVRIRSTLHLETILVSPAHLDEARATPGMEVLGPPAEMAFDAAGNLW